MKANAVSEDEDQRGLFNRFFTEEQNKTAQSFNQFAKAHNVQ